MATVAALISTKGGATKTSTCANIGALVADMGFSVLMIDGDQQQSLSSFFNIDKLAPYGFRRFLTKIDATDCISQTSIPGLDIIVNDDPTNDIKFFFTCSTHYEYLRHAINSLRPCYDFIFIDTKGHNDGAIQESAIKAADRIICPVVVEFMVAKEFRRGTLEMINRLRGPEDITLFTPPPLTVVLNRIKRNTTSHRRIIKDLQNLIRESVSIANTVIFEKEAYNRACGLRLPVHRVDFYDRKDRAVPSAYTTQLQLVNELFPITQGRRPQWKDMPRKLRQTLESHLVAEPVHSCMMDTINNESTNYQPEIIADTTPINRVRFK